MSPYRAETIKTDITLEASNPIKSTEKSKLSLKMKNMRIPGIVNNQNEFNQVINNQGFNGEDELSY